MLTLNRRTIPTFLSRPSPRNPASLWDTAPARSMRKEFSLGYDKNNESSSSEKGWNFTAQTTQCSAWTKFREGGTNPNKIRLYWATSLQHHSVFKNWPGKGDEMVQDGRRKFLTAMQTTEEEGLLRRLPWKRGRPGIGGAARAAGPQRGGALKKPARKASMFVEVVRPGRSTRGGDAKR